MPHHSLEQGKNRAGELCVWVVLADQRRTDLFRDVGREQEGCFMEETGDCGLNPPKFCGDFFPCLAQVLTLFQTLYSIPFTLAQK